MKIAVCVPVYGDTKARFTLSLAAMLLRTAKERPDLTLEVLMYESSVLPQSRARLVIMAANWGADHMLWLDADHTFPADTLLRLLAREKSVIGCNYPARGQPTVPTAGVHTTEAKAKADSVEQVARMGLGVCLMRMSVLNELPWPLFDIEMNGSRLVAGEDGFLFRKLEQAGVPVFVDHTLSWEVGHIAEFVATNAMTREGADADTIRSRAGPG